jgi:PucR family transcriptional regulator, purine catabolism regulatory protein
MLTVHELLRDLDVELLCGEQQADAPVRWVHITEIPDPTPWLSGGELLLTTGLQLDTPKRQREFVHRLADHQLAGLGFGTGFAHARMPKAIVDAAREREFPLFEVPYDVPFIALTEAAFSRLVNEQYAILRRAIAAHERLERIVLSERGLDAVAAALATLIGGALLVFDGRAAPLVKHTFRRPLEPDVEAALEGELHEHIQRGERRGFSPAHAELSARSLVLPVLASGAPDGTHGGGVPQAWLVAVKDSGGLSEFDRLALHQAVTIVALELLRGRVAGDTERRLAGDVLSSIMSGELDGADLARRLEPFGLGEQVAALVLQPLQLSTRTNGPAQEGALLEALRSESANALVATNGALVCALVPGLPEDELFALAERVTRRVAGDVGEPLRGGAGRAIAAGEARRTVHEARCAVEAKALAHLDADSEGNGAGTAGIPAEEPIATYRDLGSFQLLLALQDNDALRLFCDSILGPIEDSEGPYGGELIRSLEAFIEENGQWERAARRLYCHRHTLRYRIRRVEELTGRSLSSARDRIEFWLALRGRDLVP